MFRNRIFALLGAVLLLAGLAVPVSAAQVESGSVYCFRAGDFSAEEDLAGICITDLPESRLGTLMLGTRVLRPGDILTAEQLARMTFCPLDTEEDAAAEVGYLPIYADHVAASAAMTIAIRGREDKAPIAEDQALETYKNLPNTAKLKVTDPEGQALTYTVTRQPRRGTVEIAPDGTMTYTPTKNKVGVDSFVYTAADPAGKVSREATVTITILKPTDATQYTDTLGRDCRFAAEWMKNTGIFVGESVAKNACFSPDRQVTRGEFVTMLVNTLELEPEEAFPVTGYTDDIPLWLQPYLAAAIRAGLTAGLPDQETFGPNTPITGAEAAVMLQNALDLRASLPESDGSLPAWAETALTALADSGILLEADAPLTRGQAANALYQASALRHAEEAEQF